MNKVDRHIKKMMLQFPSLFPNRIKCLRHLFMVNGNGYDWNDEGCLVEWTYEGDRTRPADKMNYSDLDQRQDDLSKFYDEHECLRDIQKFRRLHDEKERLDRQFREKNIDLLCRYHDTYDNFTYADLQHFDPRWSAFHDAPYGNIDIDWLTAMEETITKIKYAFNQVWSLYYDHPLKGEKTPEPSMFSRMPEKFQKLYADICEVENKLDKQSGRRERMAIFQEAINDKLNVTF